PRPRERGRRRLPLYRSPLAENAVVALAGGRAVAAEAEPQRPPAAWCRADPTHPGAGRHYHLARLRPAATARGGLLPARGRVLLARRRIPPTGAISPHTRRPLHGGGPHRTPPRHALPAQYSGRPSRLKTA